MDCKELKELFSVLVLYRMNMENLHWNCKGLDFDTTHKAVTTEYYEKINEDIDVVAEMLIRLGTNPMNYKEVFDYIESADNDYMIIESSEYYERPEVFKDCYVMLEDICKCLVAALDCECMQNTRNSGIKSTLESLLDSYDIQARYISTRRLGEGFATEDNTNNSTEETSSDEESEEDNDTEEE